MGPMLGFSFQTLFEPLNQNFSYGMIQLILILPIVCTAIVSLYLISITNSPLALIANTKPCVDINVSLKTSVPLG